MKSYEEMARDVLERVHEYNAQKAKKTTAFKKSMLAVLPAGLLMLAGVGVWQTGILVQKSDYVTVPNVLETSVTTQPAASETVHSTITISDSIVMESHTEYITESVSTSAEPSVIEPTVSEAVSTEHTSKPPASESETGILSETKTETVPSDGYEHVETETQTKPSVPQTTPSPILTVAPAQTIPVPETTAMPQEETVTTDASLQPGYEVETWGYLYWNGQLYRQDTVDAAIYSLGRYLGYGSDFSGSYQNSGMGTMIYVSAESEDVLIVVYRNGSYVYLKKQ